MLSQVLHKTRSKSPYLNRWGFFNFYCTVNRLDLTIKFYANLNRNGLLSKFVWFHRLKYLSVKNTKDLSGGFIRFKELKFAAQELGTSKGNIDKLIRRFVLLGWMKKEKLGYRLIGWRKITEQYQPGLKKILFFAPDKKKLIIKYSSIDIKRNENQQIFRERGLKKRPILLNSERFSLSQRTMGYRAGYKSAMSGYRLQQLLKKEKLIKIEKQDIFVCKSEEYSAVVKHCKDLWGRCYSKDGNIYKRLCNNIIPLF